MVRAAVAYGLMFQCDPMAAFLDRPEDDLPVLMSVLRIADSRMRKAQEEARRGVSR